MAAMQAVKIQFSIIGSSVSCNQPISIEKFPLVCLGEKRAGLCCSSFPLLIPTSPPPPMATCTLCASLLGLAVGAGETLYTGVWLPNGLALAPGGKITFVEPSVCSPNAACSEGCGLVGTDCQPSDTGGSGGSGSSIVPVVAAAAGAVLVLVTVVLVIVGVRARRRSGRVKVGPNQHHASSPPPPVPLPTPGSSGDSDGLYEHLDSVAIAPPTYEQATNPTNPAHPYEEADINPYLTPVAQSTYLEPAPSSSSEPLSSSSSETEAGPQMFKNHTYINSGLEDL